MIFARVLIRGFTFNRPFLMHPRIRGFNVNSASYKEIVDQILSVLKTESEQNNHIVVKQGIEHLAFAMKSLEFEEKKSIVPDIVQFGNWFSSFKYYEGSLKCYSLALEVLKERKVEVKEDLVSVSLIQVKELLKIKNFKQCEKILQGLKKICDEFGDNTIKGEYFNTFGIVNIMLGKPSEAIVYFENAKSLFVELLKKHDVRFQLIMSINYVTMLYSIRDYQKFIENFEDSTENLLGFTDSEKENFFKCLEIWANNLCFVQDQETFLGYFFRVEEKLAGLPREFLHFLYENLIKFSESNLKASRFNVKVYENYFEFAEKFLGEDVKLIERLCTMNIGKMLNNEEYGKVIGYGKKLLEIKKRFNDFHGEIAVKNWMMDGYIGNKEVLAAKLLDKEIDSDIQYTERPDLKQHHLDNKLRLNKLLVFNTQQN